MSSQDSQGRSSSGPEPTSTLLQNPLSTMSEGQIARDARDFAVVNGLGDYEEAFMKGGLMAKAYNIPGGYEDIEQLSAVDKATLRMEDLKRWDQRPMLYLLCGLVAGCAIVQGMDQTIINGAQVRILPAFRSFELTDQVLDVLSRRVRH